MAGRHYTAKELNSYRGSNSIIGTDGDDNFTIQKNMSSTRGGARNSFNLLDGFDNVWIGGKMEAKDGSNSILGSSNNKNVTVVNGLRAGKGGSNSIVLEDQVPYYMGVKRALTLGGLEASHGGKNLVALRSQHGSDDRIAITKHVKATNDGRNEFVVEDGLQRLSFAKNVDARSGGQNNIAMGVGVQVIEISGNLDAGRDGINRISSQDGSITAIAVKGINASGGKNFISLGAGLNTIAIAKDLSSSSRGENHITSEGMTNIEILGFMKSSVLNEVKTGVGNDTIFIGKGMRATGGTNRIFTDGGNDTVYVAGDIYASSRGANIISTGEGNDTIHLNANVRNVRDLTIDAGNGWDTLKLSAANDHKFKKNYQAWFVDMAKTAVLSGSGIEEIQVDITRSKGLDEFDWLTQIINAHNAASSSPVEMSIAMDGYGHFFDLGEIFTTKNQSAITAINLTGGNANELRIDDTLAANGFNGDYLRVDSKDGNIDTVRIDSNTWNYAGYIDSSVYGNDVAYNVFGNAYGENILVQEHVNWVLA